MHQRPIPCSDARTVQSTKAPRAIPTFIWTLPGDEEGCIIQRGNFWEHTVRDYLHGEHTVRDYLHGGNIVIILVEKSAGIIIIKC